MHQGGVLVRLATAGPGECGVEQPVFVDYRGEDSGIAGAFLYTYLATRLGREPPIDLAALFGSEVMMSPWCRVRVHEPPHRPATKLADARAARPADRWTIPGQCRAGTSQSVSEHAASRRPPVKAEMAQPVTGSASAVAPRVRRGYWRPRRWETKPTGQLHEYAAHRTRPGRRGRRATATSCLALRPRPVSRVHLPASTSG